MAGEARAAGVLAAESDLGPYLNELVDRYPLALIFADSQLAVVWTNGAGRELLGEHQDFSLKNGRLCLATPDATGDFRRFLEIPAHGVRAWLYLNGDACYVLRIQHLFPPGRSPVHAITFYPNGQELPHVWPEMDALGLTAAECRVLKGMTNGKSAQDLAEHLEISSETVRTHIRRIYAKLGVNNREQLFSLTLPLRVL